MRIWDFRRGDEDDNRTSPQGGSLRRLLISAALEFNYVKAAIGFLKLIIVPAVLVGIVPSLVVTFGRLKFETATSVGKTPAVAIIVLAVLVAVALWIGRSLLPKAFESFWHLHYTLVFPIFVAVREILRSIAETFSGETCTVEQQDRRRRTGTILGALLFAGGGVLLAVRVDLSIGLQLVDVEHVRPWAVARAALGNAAVVLGISTAAESLYWVWRELGFRGRVRDWAPLSPAAPTGRVAHLSDLHFVGERYGCRMESGTRGPRGNRCLRRALRRLTAIHASHPLDRILVTGDITDAGTRAEWAEFIDLFRHYPELRARTSFVPGNHDVNIVDRNNPGRFDLPRSTSQSLRKLRVVLALDMIQGDRAHVVDRISGRLGPTLSDYLRQGKRMERLRALAEHGAVRGRWEVERVWESIFPLVEPAQGNHRCGVILLNSNARTHFSLTNAIGFVSPPELRVLKSILRNSPGVPWIIALHHQIVEYPVPSISLHERVGLALVNASDVLAAIEPYASRTIVLHGHRHWDWIGTCGGVVLCSAPSAALGSQAGEKRVGSFHVHELAFDAPEGNCLMKTKCVKVA